jgi:hypothetical protein
MDHTVWRRERLAQQQPTEQPYRDPADQQYARAGDQLRELPALPRRQMARQASSFHPDRITAIVVTG